MPEDSEEFLFCGYVDFEKEINGIRGLNIKMEKQKKDLETEIGKQKEAMEKTMELKIEAQKRDMEAQKIAFEQEIELLKNEINNLKIENQKNNSDEIRNKDSKK